MSELLSGYRVIESSVLLNGASTSMMLVDLGAEVIKVESPFLGDYLRLEETFHFHLQTNKGKRSIALDMRKDAAREVFYRLLETADVFVTNAPGNNNAKLGLSFEDLRERKPDIVYCQNTGFGAAGPYAQVPAHGQMMDALAGAQPAEMDSDGLTRPKSYVRRTGRMVAGGEGTAAGAIYAAFHIAAALAHRERTGQGCYIDVSSADAVIASAWTAASGQLNVPLAQQTWREETAMRAVARYQWYETRDHRFVLFCPEETKFWNRFCDLVGRGDLKEQQSGVTLRHEIQKIFHTRDQAEWMRLAIEHRLPIGPAYDEMDEIKADPHVQARGILHDAHIPGHGDFTYIAQPARIGGQQPVARTPAPHLGQHTHEILLELGYTPERIEQLAREFVTTAEKQAEGYMARHMFGTQQR
ncbi:MAG: CaiB/BaiF CoA-transferase family protein [Steroidobacteraceae bacterium]